MTEIAKKVQIDDDHARIFLLAILLSGVVTMLNTSTVTISLPTYMSVFGVDINTVQWVVIGIYASIRYGYATERIFMRAL